VTQAGSPETLAIVLLAAGGSRRLGQSKQLIPIDGEALVRRTARRLLSLQPTLLRVVTGCVGDEVSDRLSGLPLQIVHNPQWREGMGTSIAHGVKNLPPGIRGVLIMLCDQWRVDSADLNALLEVWITDISDIVSASWKEDKFNIHGPPAIFRRSLFHELESLTGDQGAKRIIEKFSSKSAFVAMENAAFDLDEPGDLQHLT